MPRQLHLNLFVQARGHHETSWNHPEATAHKLTDIAHYQDLSRRAEAALFDSLFFADSLMLSGDAARSGRLGLEPITLLAALAVSTERIGLIATGSCTYTEPYNLARQFASIDHMSHGRAGWNIVTTWMEGAARNYGAEHTPHDDRYAIGDEFVAAVKALWNSWADDAVVDLRHKAGGVYADSNRIGRSISPASSTRCPGRSICRAARRGGRCWCKPVPPTSVATSPRATPRRCSRRTWRRSPRRSSMPTSRREPPRPAAMPIRWSFCRASIR